VVSRPPPPPPPSGRLTVSTVTPRAWPKAGALEWHLRRPVWRSKAAVWKRLLASFPEPANRRGSGVQEGVFQGLAGRLFSARQRSKNGGRLKPGVAS
jgi:hypothetical protein